MSENRENEIKNSEEFVESMLTSARSIIRTCLQIRSFETILIVTDPESSVKVHFPVLSVTGQHIV